MQKQTKLHKLFFTYAIAIIATALLWAVVFLSFTSVKAAVGSNETVNYQGRLLTDTGAVVADGSYNMEFKITQDGDGCNPTSGTFPCGGTVVWTETRESGNKVLVKNGYFSVYLGAVTPFGSSVDWNQDTLWLSINIGGTGTPTYDGVMKPLTRLSSSPYALNSKHLGGRTSAQFIQLSPNAVQLASSVTPAMHISQGSTGNIATLAATNTAANGVSVGVQSNSSSQYALKITADNGATNAFYVRADGNVGIGTVAPVEKLHVTGNILIGAKPDATAHNFASGCSCLANSAVGTFGSETARDAVVSSVVYKGKLFISTRETDGAAVYRYDGGTTWTMVTNSAGKAVSLDSANIDSYVLTVFNGALYIGSQGTANTAGLYSSTTAHTTADSFQLVNATRGSFGMSQTLVDGISDMTVWNGNLIISTAETDAWELGRYDGGTAFTQINPTDGKIVAADAADMDGALLSVYNNLLFIGAVTGSTTARVGVHEGVGTTINSLNATNGTFGSDISIVDVTSMEIYNGQLYVGVSKPNAGAVYRWLAASSSTSNDASNWNMVNLGAGEMNSGDTVDTVDSVILRSYNGRLYAGTNTGADNSAALYEYAGTKGDWTLINTTRGTFGAQAGVNDISSLQIVDGTFYVGVDEPNAGSIYSWSKTKDSSYSLKFDSGLGNYGSLAFVGGTDPLTNNDQYGTFRFTNAVALTSGAFDYAEDYPSLDSSLLPGEPVSVDLSYPEHVKRAGPGDIVLGVVSENPGLRLSSEAAPASGAKWVPIALVGRVPVKVSGEAGPIKPGDQLALSATPGVLQKAGPAGQVVGSALEGYEGAGVSKLMMYVNPGWHISDEWLTGGSRSPETEGIKLSSLGGLTIEDEDGNKVASIDRAGNATFAGTITANKLKASQIEGLELIGPAEFLDVANFHKLVTFNSAVLFKHDLQFLGRPTFNNDTGGYAVIKAGHTEVEIVFTKPYVISPLVTVSLNDGQFLTYTYKELSEKGFKIALKAPADKDAQFSWTAFAIDNPLTKISKLTDIVEPLE